MASAPVVVGRGLASPPDERSRAASRRKASRRNVLSALLFLSPWLVGFLVFTAWPLIYSAYLSLTDYDVINNANFIGLENYAELFADPKIALSLSNTLLFTAVQVPLYVIVSLSLALLLQRASRSAGFFRTIFFLPKMTPPVAVGILFLLLFNGQGGLINQVLGVFGIDGPSWTTDPNWIKPGLVLMSLWTVAASVIILLAALKNVPEQLYESARIDGAGFFRQAFSVTLPMISPAIFFIIIVNTIAGLQTFDEAYTAFFGAGNTTYGNDAALFYSIYLFQQAFQFLNMGYASAMAWLLFLLIMIVTAIQLIVSRRLVYYEGEAPK